jgi:hypothetical protein
VQASGVNRHSHDAVMLGVMEIVVAPPDMDKREAGTLEGFDSLFTGHPGKLHATTGSFSFTSTSTGTGFFRMVRVSI